MAHRRRLISSLLAPKAPPNRSPKGKGITGYYGADQPIIRPPESLFRSQYSDPGSRFNRSQFLNEEAEMMCDRIIRTLNDSLSRHGLPPARFEPFPEPEPDGRSSCACIIDDRAVSTGSGYTTTEAIHNSGKEAYWRLFDMSNGEPGIYEFLAVHSDSGYSATQMTEVPSTSTHISPEPGEVPSNEPFVTAPKETDAILESFETTPQDTIKAVMAKKKLEPTPEISWPKGAVSWWGPKEESAPPKKRKLETSPKKPAPWAKPKSQNSPAAKKAKVDKSHIAGTSGLAKVSKFTVKPGAKMQYHDLEPGEVAPDFLDADPEDLDLHEKIPTEPCTRTADNKMTLINELGQTKALVAQKSRKKGANRRDKYCILEIINQKSNEPIFKVEAFNFTEAADHGLEFLVNKLTNLEAPPPKRISKGYTAWLIRKKFVQIVRSDPWLFVSGKCLAGFIMEKDGDFYPVSLGTGSTFIDKGDLGGEGEEIIDCHAEVIARRGLMRFLWSELEKSLNEETKEESIFERKKDSSKFALKSSVHFHLFISMPPCGFSQCYGKVNYYLKSEWSEKEVEHDLNRREKEVAYLAAKVGREGPGIYHGTLNLGPRTDDKIQSLACSDKVLKWNICGYQGGMLSEFIEPIHMESFTLGCKFDPRRVTRAVCCRLTGYYEDGKNHPRILRYPDPPEGFMVINDHSRLFAINWNVFDNTVEVVNAHTGRIQNSANAPSRLCKRSLSAMAVRIWKKTKERSQIPERYWELKPHHYCAARDLFYRRLLKWGCGDWSWSSTHKDITKQFKLQVSKFSL